MRLLAWMAKRNADEMLQKAFQGDMAIRVSPTDDTPAPTSAAWSKKYVIELVDSAGNVHEWFEGNIPVSIADTSTAGVASLAGSITSVDLVRGRAEVTVNGTAAAWLNAETVTLKAGANTAGTKVFSYGLTQISRVRTFTTA